MFQNKYDVYCFGDDRGLARRVARPPGGARVYVKRKEIKHIIKT